MTICPAHGKECQDACNCPQWRQQRRQEAEDLSYLLENIHYARASGGLLQALDYLAPVPAIKEREEDQALMIWAYALLVNRLIQGDNCG